MSPISLGEAVVEVGADTTRFKGQLTKGIEGAAAGAKSSLGRIPATAGRAGQDAGTSFAHRFKHGVKDIAISGGSLIGLVGLEEGLKTVVEKATDAQKAGRLTAQVIKTTGGVAGVSAKHVDELSRAIEHKSVVDHMQVQSGENMLLTFKNIRNESGKGNKIYDQATQAIVDMNAAMAAAGRGGAVSIKSEAIQLGKALNDPTKGLTALTRVGVTFTAEQKKQIKTLVDTGHRMQAQKIILRELKSEFGGAANSQATNAERAKLAINDLEESIGKKLLPVVDRLAIWTTTKAVPAISKFVDQMHTGEGAGGALARDLTILLNVGKGVTSFFNGLPGPVKKTGIEVLLLAYGVGKLNGFLSSSSASFTAYRGRIAAAETTTGKFRAGLGAAGGAIRNLAGAGGMLALSDGVKRGTTALGALEVTAGAAAVGFSVGGPLGAGIGAAAGGLYELGKWALSSGNAAKSTLPTWTSYASTLTSVGAATSAATRAMVLEHLQKSGLLQQTQALNISDRDAVQAAMGNVAARQRVSAALADATSKGKNYQALNVAQHLGAETTAIYSSRVAQLQKNLALAATKEEAQKIQAKLDRLARTNANPTISIGGVGPAISKLNAVLQLLHDIGAAKGGNAQLPKPGSLLSGLGGKPPQTAVGGVFAHAQTRTIAEAGREAVVPLDRGLSSVDPSVRYLSAVAQGKALPLPSRDTYSSTGPVSNTSSVQLVIQNPVPETTTQSLPRALANLAFVVGG